jgi:acyl-coenzyme A synthetase/AMP-(fatty) acid ligase
MIPEAIFAMLACARLGVTHSVVFGEFAAQELAGRIRDSGAKLIFQPVVGLSRIGWSIIRRSSWLKQRTLRRLFSKERRK